MAFLDREVAVGSKAAAATELIKRRGFATREPSAVQFSKYDQSTESFVPLPLTDRDIAQQNIGFVRLVGQPDGELRCYIRRYNRVIASGVRNICMTVSPDGKVIWRQAGFTGAHL